MSLRNRPPEQTGLDAAIASPLLRVIERVKSHVAHWPRRYVGMRIEAIDGER